MRKILNKNKRNLHCLGKRNLSPHNTNEFLIQNSENNFTSYFCDNYEDSSEVCGSMKELIEEKLMLESYLETLDDTFSKKVFFRINIQ